MRDLCVTQHAPRDPSGKTVPLFAPASPTTLTTATTLTAPAAAKMAGLEYNVR